MEDFDIVVYEIACIKNNQTICMYISENLEDATETYETLINTYVTNNTKDHIIIYLYDYNKQTNINYYNNYDEI